MVNGLILKSHGFIDRQTTPRLMVIHAMAEYILYGGELIPAAQFLKLLGLSAHFTVLPSGLLVQHLPVWTKGAHAKGHNHYTVGVELLIPGIIDYDGLLKQMRRDCNAYDIFSKAQYRGLLELLKYLIDAEYLDHPYDYTFHEDLSPGRKFDPGPAFHHGVFREMVDLRFNV